MAANRTYFAIDLKSFYASVECVDRHLDPLTTNLVVADASRTEKTICLAVSPSLKAYKIPGRARLFEVVQRVKEVNEQRLRLAIRPAQSLARRGRRIPSGGGVVQRHHAERKPQSGRRLHRRTAPDGAVSRSFLANL